MERALGYPNYQNLNSLQEKGRSLREWRELVETWEVSVETLGDSVYTVSWGGGSCLNMLVINTDLVVTMGGGHS